MQSVEPNSFCDLLFEGSQLVYGDGDGAGGAAADTLIAQLEVISLLGIDEVNDLVRTEEFTLQEVD